MSEEITEAFSPRARNKRRYAHDFQFCYAFSPRALNKLSSIRNSAGVCSLFPARPE